MGLIIENEGVSQDILNDINCAQVDLQRVLQVIFKLCEAGFLVGVEPDAVIFANVLQLEECLVLELLLGETALIEALQHS